MIGKRMSPADQVSADRLDAVLASPSSMCTDSEVTELVMVTQMLAPAVHPREAFRAALKDRLLRTQQGNAPQVRPGAGSFDGMESSVHSLEVTSPLLGVVRLADVERIDPERAAAVVQEIATHVVDPVRSSR